MKDKNSIPSSFIGYNKSVVDQLLKEKDGRLKTQQEDINYLRKELLDAKRQASARNSLEK